MPNIFYTIFIFPIEFLISLCYTFIYRILDNPGLSIIGLSIVVSTLILPIYIMTEKQQDAEREKQKLLKRMKDNINAVYKGDKRYMLLSTLYRQNNYHPIYALRSSLGLLIQIPFFIAAYHFLSHLEMLSWRNFLIFKDLSAPDRLLSLGGGGVNLLPILMTFINVISGFIYTKGFETKDKLQVYGIALIFLILLYNSPSGLVLYWTCNNIYNLIKNILIKSKYSEKIIKYSLSVFTLIISIYLLFIHDGVIIKRLSVIALFAIILFFLFFKVNIFNFINQKINVSNTSLERPFKTFILSLIGLFLLIGLVIPSFLISSSVTEFSFINPLSSPLPFIINVMLQSFGIIFWLFCIYYLFNIKVKIFFTIIFSLLLNIFIFNSFIFTGEQYGLMAADLTFLNYKDIPIASISINILLLIVITIFTIFLLFNKFKIILFSLHLIIIISFLSLGVYNIIKINNNFNNLSKPIEHQFENPLSKNYYKFTKTGKNILLIVLDNFSPGYIPYIFEEKPELLPSYKGFIHYKNTVSFGFHTYLGMPGIWGGYNYHPKEIHKQDNVLYSDKFIESSKVLPFILSESNFNVSVIDQYWVNYSNHENINLKQFNTLGNFSNFYMKNSTIELKNDFDTLINNLIMFSFLKTSPLFLHKLIYDWGDYLNFKNISKYNKGHTIDPYTSLYYLSEVTETTDEIENQAILMVSILNCYPSFMKAPDYIPYKNVPNGNSTFSNDGYYHKNMTSLILLAKWFDFLKENDIFDNTRIILVSDHPNNSKSPFIDNIILPDGKMLDSYNALLMYKDFNSKFEFTVNNDFMTNADVPFLASKGFIQELINPFDNKEMIIDKENGVLIACLPTKSEANEAYENTGNFITTKWLHVHTNIFDIKNWSLVENE